MPERFQRSDWKSTNVPRSVHSVAKEMLRCFRKPTEAGRVGHWDGISLQHHQERALGWTRWVRGLESIANAKKEKNCVGDPEQERWMAVGPTDRLCCSKCTGGRMASLRLNLHQHQNEMVKWAALLQTGVGTCHFWTSPRLLKNPSQQGENNRKGSSPFARVFYLQGEFLSTFKKGALSPSVWSSWLHQDSKPDCMCKLQSDTRMAMLCTIH